MTAALTTRRAQTPSPRAALGAACGAGFLWGTGALVVDRLIAHHGFTPESISFWRFGVGSIVLLAVFGRRSLWPAARPHLGMLLGAGACVAGYVWCWFRGIEAIGPSVPTLIALCLPPILVTFVALLRGRERLDRPLCLVLAAALVGTTLVVVQPGAAGSAVSASTLWTGVGFSIASALLYALFTLVSGPLSQALGAGPMATCLTLVATAVTALSALHRPLTLPAGLPPEAWVLYLGVVTAALALLAFSWGAAHLSPTALTVATLVEPLTAVVLAALLLGQRPSLLQGVGGLLLMSAIWLLGRRPAPAA